MVKARWRAFTMCACAFTANLRPFEVTLKHYDVNRLAPLSGRQSLEHVFGLNQVIQKITVTPLDDRHLRGADSTAESRKPAFYDYLYPGGISLFKLHIFTPF